MEQKTEARRPYAFLDLDGTLIDNRKRLYHFLTEHAPEGLRDALTIEEFWQLKRMGVHEAEWLNAKYHAGIDRAAWDAEKRSCIETPEYLALDELFPYTAEVLARLRESYALILVTRRSNREAFEAEWERLGLGRFFTAVLVTSHAEGGKAERIAREYSVDRECDILAGDTEDDIAAGAGLGLRTYLVLSGIRGRWAAQRYGSGVSRLIVAEDIRDIPYTI